MKIFKIPLILLLVLFLHNFALAEELSFSGYDPSSPTRDWNENKFFKRISTLFDTNIYANAKNDYDVWLNYLSNTKEENMANVLFKASLSKSLEKSLYDQNKIINLYPYLKEYCPNLINLDAKYNIFKRIQISNNVIASLPYINPLPQQNYIWINKNYCKKLNIDVNQINTIQSFYDTLKAFKLYDLDGDGKNDEEILVFKGIWDLKFLSHALGIISNDFNVFNENNTIKLNVEHEEFYNFIKFCKKLYDENIILKNNFVDNINLDNKPKNKSNPSCIIAPSVVGIVEKDNIKDYVILQALSYDNKQIYRKLPTDIISGCFAITSSADENQIIKALKIIDFLYTEEGSVLANYGMENEDYIKFSNGFWEWNSHEGQSLENIYTNSIIHSESFLPGIEAIDFQSKFDNNENREIIKYRKNFEKYLTDPIQTNRNLTVDELLKLNDYYQLNKYIDINLTEFIIGEKNLDDLSWSSFIKGLNKYNKDNYLKLWNNIINGD